jgi:L,D-transpeptidase ErfK/SrfK
VPAGREAAIIINVPQRRLFYYRDGDVFRDYPIATGKASWPTPIAPFTVQFMERDPTWDVPLSIQEEMRREGKPVVTQVPPSPDNPLGKYWIGLSLSSVGIHGTNAPNSIYKFQTHGCIRLHPDDIEDLFSLVNTGDAGEIVYEPVLLAAVKDGIFLEVHPDIYKKGINARAVARELAAAAGLLDAIDWSAAEEVIRKRDGIARDVSIRIKL